MAYSNYRTLKQVIDKFGLDVERQNLFSKVNPIEPADWLVKSLEVSSTLPAYNEKSKSELFIMPILVNIYQIHKDKLTLFSGEELNIEPENDLNGPCDFFFSKKPNAALLEAPIVSLTEAKKENMDYGVAQCTAQMIGAQKFNQAEGKEIKTIWGCATTAGEWKFLKLTDNKLILDNKSYYLDQLDILLGIFYQIFEQV